MWLREETYALKVVGSNPNTMNGQIFTYIWCKKDENKGERGRGCPIKNNEVVTVLNTGHALISNYMLQTESRTGHA